MKSTRSRCPGGRDGTLQAALRAAGEGAPLDGIPPNTGAYTPVRFDDGGEDRRFLLVPTADWASTDLYELVDGGAAPGMDIPGWSYAFVQVR